MENTFKIQVRTQNPSCCSVIAEATVQPTHDGLDTMAKDYGKNNDCPVIAIETVKDGQIIDFIDYERKTLPVTIRRNENGEPDGVRVRTIDEDFVIALHDTEKDIDWKAAMEKYGEENLPNRKQAAIISAYLDDIQGALTEAGGDKLEGLYWTCSEYYANGAWYFNGYGGSLDNGIKGYGLSVRPVLAFAS